MVTCREYNIALRIELKRKEIRDDPKRVAELAAYFTHCNLQPVHMALSLRSAMSIFFKLKNFDTCHHFCRRLLELNPGAKVRRFAGLHAGPAAGSHSIALPLMGSQLFVEVGQHLHSPLYATSLAGSQGSA